MKVLIVDFDFFAAAGGGQTYYRRIVERNPDVDFWFFTNSADVPTGKSSLPANAVAVPLRRPPSDTLPYVSIRHIFPDRFEIETLDRALAVAYSVSGMRFDAVDVPSYYPWCHLLRGLFAHYSVEVDRLAFGLHGWISVGILSDWEVVHTEKQIDKWRMLERASFQAADIRYAISKQHIEECRVLEDLPVQYVDVQNILDESAPLPAELTDPKAKPDLWFVGRLEKLKGPDLFLDLVADIPRDLYEDAYLIGPDGQCASGQLWSSLLADHRRELGTSAQYLGCLSRGEVTKKVYEQRSMIIFSSRGDTFNLAVMEAVARGCPSVISIRAGAHRFLRDEYPDLPVISFDPDCRAATLESIVRCLSNFNSCREKLVSALATRPIRQPSRNFIQSLYRTPRYRDDAVVKRIDERIRRAFQVMARRESILLGRVARNLSRTLKRSFERRLNKRHT